MRKLTLQSVAKDEVEYAHNLNIELESLSIKLHKKLSVYRQVYTKVEVNTFLSQGAKTFDSIHVLPKDFPNHLKVASTSQLSLYYSNLCKTCLLFSYGYADELINEGKVSNIFPVDSNLSILDRIESLVELFKYLLNLFKSDPKKEREEYTFLSRLSQLEKRVKLLEDKVLK